MRRWLKVLVSILILFVLIYLGLVVELIIAKPKIVPLTYEKRGGTAIVITGAAARIVQEAALLEHLDKTGWLRNVCFISGTSSGALNTVMLNAVLQKKISWEHYNSLLFELNNDDIYIKTDKSLPVNNEPYHNLLTHIVNDSLGYRIMGDLPFNSSMSISDVDLFPPFSKTYRLSNIKINPESNPAFNLVDVLMASTAIPVIFPPVRFKESFGLPNSSFIDGGLGEDHIPYTAVLQFEKYRNYGVDTLIIVSRKSDINPEFKNELLNLGNNDSRISGRLNYRIENLARNSFIKSMRVLQQKYPELAERTYVFIPDFPEDFALLDFSNLKKQYMVCASWAESHKPVPLNQFLAENAMEEKSHE
jgi:predicted acylesterase/phospholipase RssA